MNTESADNEVPPCMPITLKCISSAWTPALNLCVVIQLAAGQECACLIDISNCLCHSLKSWSPQTCSFGTLPFHLDIPSFSSCSSNTTDSFLLNILPMPSVSRTNWLHLKNLSSPWPFSLFSPLPFSWQEFGFFGVRWKPLEDSGKSSVPHHALSLIFLFQLHCSLLFLKNRKKVNTCDHLDSTVVCNLP